MDHGKKIRDLPKTGFIRLEAVLELIPVSRSVWYKGVKEGRFPEPVKMSDRIVAWRVDDIRVLIKEMSDDPNN